MPAALPIARMTYAEYVASEAASPVKREFIAGQVLGERLELRSIGASLDVSAVYENPLEAN